MSPLSASDVVAPAFQHVKQQLRSRLWSQWWRIAVLGLLAGEASSFGCSGPGRLQPPAPSSTSSDESVLAAFVVVAVAGLLLCLFVMAVTYVNSICRFILIETVVSRRCEGLRNGWRKWRPVGRRFFLWQATFLLATTIALGTLFGVSFAVAAAAGWIANPAAHVAPIAFGGFLLFSVAFAVFVVAMLVYVTAKDFVAPVMAVEQVGVAAAWRLVLDIMRTDRWNFAGYFLVKTLLTLSVATIMITLALVARLPQLGATMIASGAATGVSDISFSTLPMALLVGTGVVVTSVALCALFLLNVPIAVFFPAFSLYFLAGRYAGLEPWLAPAAPAVTADRGSAPA